MNPRELGLQTALLLAPLLAHPPLGLLSDIDGTLSPIAATPDAAQVSPSMQSQLRTLQPHLALVAAISGRGAADAARLLGVAGMLVVGNHGLEQWEGGLATPLAAAVPYQPVIAAVLAALARQPLPPGVFSENKGVTASVHYRGAPDPAAAAALLHALLAPLAAAHGLRLTAGRMVWELRPPLPTNKGHAVHALVERFALRSVIFLGDDTTDVDAFRALHTLRDAGRHTLSIGVLASETPPAVREAADLLLDGVAGPTGVEGFLAHLVELVVGRDHQPGA